VNQVIVVEAPGGAGSLLEFVEPMAELPPTRLQTEAQLKQLFPGAAPAFELDAGTPDSVNTVYVFQDEGATVSHVIVASKVNGVVTTVVVVGSGSYKSLVPRCC